MLGGTVFLGRHIVEAALARGHEVTLFNRGKSAPSLFGPEVESLQGDRSVGDLARLRGRSWDAVIDTSAYVPRVVRDSASLLADQVSTYVIISSISVYPTSQMDKSENAPVLRLEDPTAEDIGANYGAMKAQCEQEANRLMPDRVLVARSGLIVGPYDPTDRFTYWALRMRQGGEVLAPGDPNSPVQVIHARDEAEWLLDMCHAGAVGTYNVTGGAVSMDEVLRVCARVTSNEPTLVWAPDEFLIARGLKPFVDLPLWIPRSEGSLRAPIGLATEKGLRTRSLLATARDTVEWALGAGLDLRGRPDGQTLRAGLGADLERQIIDDFHHTNR